MASNLTRDCAARVFTLWAMTSLVFTTKSTISPHTLGKPGGLMTQDEAEKPLPFALVQRVTGLEALHSCALSASERSQVQEQLTGGMCVAWRETCGRTGEKVPIWGWL
jgi:hypothetical protein